MLSWTDYERALTGEEGDTMAGDRLALTCFALILLLGLLSIGQSIAMALGH